MAFILVTKLYGKTINVADRQTDKVHSYNPLPTP